MNRTFRFVTLGMPPFGGVQDVLEYLSQNADILVVSATPYSDLADWWTGTGLAQYVQSIAGKEMGKKADHIRLLKEAGGYEADHKQQDDKSDASEATEKADFATIV